MHSSRMRIIRSSIRLLGVPGPGGCLVLGMGWLVPGKGVTGPGEWRLVLGVVCSGVVCLLWGVFASGGCLVGGGCIPTCTEADPPPFGQTHTCKNITFATSLQTVIRTVYPLKLKSKEYRIVKPRTYPTDHIWVPKFSLSQVTPEQPFVSLQQVASVCGQYEKKISLCLSRLGLDEVVHCGTVHF